MADRVSHTLMNAVDVAKRVLVVGDGRPDGDSIGASTALYRLMKNLGKDTKLFCITKAPEVFSFIDHIDEQTNDVSVFDEPWDLVMTVDGGDLNHIGIADLLSRIPTVAELANIDHHATNTQFGTINFVDTLACSTCEVIHTWMANHGLEIDPQIATSLLLGMMTDTSTFHNSGTNETGMRAAADLCKRGARSHEIIRRITMNKDPESFRLWGSVLARLRFLPEQKLVYTYATSADIDAAKNGQEALDGISNFLNASCSDADTVLVLRELPNGHVKGSFRSLERDVSAVCQKFGGGGHKKAAGFIIEEPFSLNADGEPHVLPRIKLALA